MLTLHDSVLLLVDVQERLLPAMPDAEALLANLTRLVAGAGILGLPVLVTEQLPEKLGPTVAPLVGHLPHAPVFAKQSFSCLGAPGLAAQLAASGRRQVLLAGIETHVCVWQTARDLLAGGLQVELVADAVSSRATRNRDLAITRMTQEGARLSTVEMALLELLGEAGNDRFRQLLKLIR